MSQDLYARCQLEGEELDDKVGELLGERGKHYSTDWADGGPLIESNEIFLEPPREMLIYYGKGKRGESRPSRWERTEVWTATVSANVRTRPNPNDPELPATVGRGAGATPLLAAMRAIVDSFG